MQINKSLLRLIMLTQILVGLPACAMQAPQQSLSQYQFGAASVLPMTHFKGNKYVILGREAGGNDKGTYDDFGGSRDKGEKHPSITAAREFFEEGITQATLGMDANQAKARIDVGSKANTTEAVLANNNAVTFVVNFPSAEIIGFRSNFHAARAHQKSHKFKEKDRIATVRWDRLEAAIKCSKTNTGVQVQARLIDPNSGQEDKHATMITLRPFFVKRLRPYIENAPYQVGKNPKIRFY